MCTITCPSDFRPVVLVVVPALGAYLVGNIRAVRAVHHAVRARCVRFPRARTTFSFPLCCFLHLTTICPSLVVSPCAVAAG